MLQRPSPTTYPDRGSRLDRGLLRICVIGSGTRFLSGISYYTNRLARELSASHRVSVMLMRQLMPSRFYPGRARVGQTLADLTYPSDVEVLDGVDWFWGRTLVPALALLRRERPAVVVMQWWTGTVLHTYLVLAVAARLLGAKVVIEYHEVLDTGELGIAPARWYVSRVAPLLFRLADGAMFHNEFDRHALMSHYKLDERPSVIAQHGPYDQYLAPDTSGPDSDQSRLDSEICHLLYLGVIRPFKGVEDLVAAFELLSDDDVRRFRLTIVGETWEGWTLPAEMIARSPRRDSISFVNRYVSDEEVGQFFGAADAVVLPYHRSSASGPLHLAMAHGLPVVVSAVGGLVEAVEGYEGAITVPPRDPSAIADALLRTYDLRGRRFECVHSWQGTVERYDELFREILGSPVGNG
jgi:glycosyltransferase involved in cell wall biosynthesis